MRSCFALAALAAIGSCGSDPTLAVVVQHPDGLDVATTDVTVYESQTLTCEDVEFGLLDDAQLAALTTADETIEPGGAVTGNLDGISRTNNKVIVARGYDTTGALIAAGCVQVGLVSGNASVTITTVVAATVALQPPSDAMNLATVVTATDPSGAPIDARPISWSVYGPAGSTPSSTANITVASDGVWGPTMPTCTSQGVAQVHVAPPDTVGGYAVQMRVAWATEQAPLFTNLTAANFTVQALSSPPPATVGKYCAIRHSGTTQRLDCFDGSFTATDYAVTVSGNTATLVPMGTQAVPATTVALLSVPSGSDLGVYAIDSSGDLTALFGAPAPTNTGSKCVAAGCIDDAIVLPPCGAVDGRILIHGNGLEKILDYKGDDENHDFAQPGAAPEFDNAGCITQLGSGAPTLVQAASVLTGAGVAGSGSGSVVNVQNIDLIACSNGGCATQTGNSLANSLTRGAAVGFTGGTEPRLIAPSVDATGVVLVQLVLSASGGVIERARMPAAAEPDRIVAGEFDTDGQPDFMWDIVTTKTGVDFEVAYARQVGDQALEALSPATTASVTDILAGDLTGDGLDDLVVLASVTQDTTTTTGLALVPMGVSAPVTVMTDPTCSP